MDLGIWDLLSRFTFWKFERDEKENSFEKEDFLEHPLSEDTEETPGNMIKLSKTLDKQQLVTQLWQTNTVLL